MMISRSIYSKHKELMIEKQLVARGITNQKILNAFREIERHDFVEPVFAPKAYSDMAVPIKKFQTISKPFMVAKMTQYLEVEKDMSVLEIGTGSGFQAAILSYLGCRVFSVERHKSLLEGAKRRFTNYKLDIKTQLGDGTLGWKEKEPFSRIITTAGAPDIPEALFEQLAENGIMIIPVGTREKQKLVKIKKKNNQAEQEELMDCRFVPLIGKEGWRE